MIHTWKEHENDFKSGKYKGSEVWKKISTVLQNENNQWVYTGTQCENKFKELRKKYIKVKDHNAQSGNSPMTCKFYNELEEVLENKPYIQPVALASNLKKRLISKEVSSSQESETEDEVGKENCTEKKKMKKLKFKKSWVSGMLLYVKMLNIGKTQENSVIRI